MSYSDMIDKIFNNEQQLRDCFLREMKKLGIQVDTFDDIDKIKKYPDEYVKLVSQNIGKFKHFGTIDLILYSLGVYKSKKAFEWLTTKWLELIESSPIYNSNAREYYEMFKLMTGRKLSNSINEYICELKEKAIWTTFQILSLTTPRNQMEELYILTNEYDIDRVTESLIILSKNGFHDEIVTRIIDELSPLIRHNVKYGNVFVYLSNNIVCKRFIPYLELLSNDKSKEVSLASIRVLKSKKYQKIII